MNDHFRKFAHHVSEVAGKPTTFISAVFIIITWASLGPVFHFTDTWQLFINTTTTIMTFLMVFLIQNTQNRDARAMQLKLDELIFALKSARDTMIDLESLSDAELDRLESEFHQLREKITQHKQKRKSHKHANEKSNQEI